MNVTRPTAHPADSFMVLPGMSPKRNQPNGPGMSRLRGIGWLPNRARVLFIACLGEFVGTFLFLFIAFTATQVGNNLLGDRPMDISTLMYISLAFGFSLAVNVWIFFRISGGLFNPAVTIAMALIGGVPWIKAGLLIFSQLLAGIAAAGIVSCLFPGPLSVSTSLSAGTSVIRGLFIEMFLTAQLVFAIFMLAAEKHRSTFIAPIGIGLALFVAELAGVFFTGGSLNPARSFGPCVILHSFHSYHWIYWVGPLLGAILAVIFYRLIKVLEYETANPDADSDGQSHRGASQGGEYADGRPPTHRSTDGADDHDFTSGFQDHMARHKAKKHKNAKTTNGLHGHHANDYVDHAGERPVTQHTNADHAYRNGPSAESGVAS